MDITLDRLTTAYESFQAFEERCFILLDTIAELPAPGFDLHRRRMHYALARLATGHHFDEALDAITWVNENPDPDNMFVWHVNMDALLRFGHLYPPELAELVGEVATSHAYEIHHGQTENHKLMIAVAGYLAAQTWPDWEQADATFERMDRYLNRFFHRLTHFGQGEFDSPTYSVLYLNTLATLYDFALDPWMRQKAEMMLEWFLVNIAGEWLEGLFAGAHARDYHPTAGLDDATGGRTVGWLYFGGRPPDLERGEPHYAVINALSGYRAPEIVTYLAQDRLRPYVHRETHDLMPAGQPTHDDNTTYRLNDEMQGFGYMTKGGVRKVTYMTPGYALGSMVDGKEGDVIWAGQLRRWSLVWQTDQPAGVLFFTHPFPDGRRGGDVYRRLWRGSSPYEQVLQHESALIALYNVPEGETYTYGPREPIPSDHDPFIEGFFPESALVALEEASGWIFAHGGEVLIAVRPLRPYVWLNGESADAPLDRDVRPHHRLVSEGLKNGVIVEVADPEDYGDPSEQAPSEVLRQFRETMLDMTRVDADLSGTPAATYTTLRGDELHLTYDGDRMVNGEVIVYDDWPVIDNPFVHSALNSGILTLRYGAYRRELDYNTWTVRDGLA
jgi:hypothetical protein